MTRITNDELKQIRLNFSRCANLDVAVFGRVHLVEYLLTAVQIQSLFDY